MRDAQPQAIRLADYQPSAFSISNVTLDFDLYDDRTFVKSTLNLAREGGKDVPLVLDGQELKLLSLSVDGRELNSDEYSLDPDSLTISNVPNHFELQILTEIHPETNTSLEGLYRSRTMFCTQCEAEGFRKITYYLDRQT